MTVSALRLTSTDSLCYKYAWNQNGRPLNELNIEFGGYFYLLPVRVTARRDHAVDNNTSRASAAQRSSSVDGLNGRRSKDVSGVVTHRRYAALPQQRHI